MFSSYSDHRSVREDGIEGMLRDAFNMHDYQRSVGEDYDIGDEHFTEIRRNECVEEPNGDATKFYNLLDEMNESISEGSKHSKLSFCIRLFHLTATSVLVTISLRPENVNDYIGGFSKSVTNLFLRANKYYFRSN